MFWSCWKKMFLFFLWSLNCNWNKLPSAKSLKECPCFIFAWRRNERKIKRGQNRKYFATSHNCSQHRIHIQCSPWDNVVCACVCVYVSVCVCVCLRMRVKGKRGWGILYKEIQSLCDYDWIYRGTWNLAKVLFVTRTVVSFIYF